MQHLLFNAHGILFLPAKGGSALAVGVAAGAW